MAWEITGFAPGGLKAAASLATKQYYGVKVSADNQVNIVAADGEPALGVLQNAPASGEAADVMCMGITKVYAGSTLTAGQLWGFDANGAAEPKEDNNTGAALGNWVMGMVIEGAAASGYATVTVGLFTGLIGSTFGAG